MTMNEQMISKVVEEVLRGMNCNNDKMSLTLAKALIEKVEKKATEMGLNVVIAIADEAGRTKVVHSMDGAYVASFDVAVNKAFTAIGFQMSTEVLGSLAQPGGPLYGIQHTNEGKIVVFGGGELLKVGDKIIGAIGISGGSAEQDIALAVYGKEVIKEVISCL